MSELDSEILKEFLSAEASNRLFREMRALIQSFIILPEDVAIPPGVPVSWLTALPIGYRLRSRLRNYCWPHDWIVKEPFYCSQLMNIRGLGMSSLNELLCVLESAELGQTAFRSIPQKHETDDEETEHGERLAEIGESPAKHNPVQNKEDLEFQTAVNKVAREAIRAGFLHFERHGTVPDSYGTESERVCSISALGDLFREFAAWALSETDVLTFGEAISLVMSETNATETWQALAEFELKQASHQPSQPYTIFESWASHLPDRERYIFDRRIACFEVSHTLQDLGTHLGITRERVRQLEKRVRRKLSILMRREEAGPIRWRAETIRHNIGVASPLANVEHLLSSLVRQEDYRGIVLGIAGPYDFVNEWLILKSAIGSEPSKRIRETADEVGFIDSLMARQVLGSWGLDSSLHEEWLLRDGKVRKLNGCLIRWDGSIGDKLISALALIGRPTTIEALLEYVQEDRTRTSALNALSNDPRAVRVSRTKWGLVSWDLPEFSGIAAAIRQLLERQGRPMPIDEIVTCLRRELRLRDNSIRAYCQAPMFIVEDGAVRLRRRNEPYEYERVSLRNAIGVFVLGPRRLSLLIGVDSELLRGSGRPLTHAAGSHLKVAINQVLTFKDIGGESVAVTFPEASLVGPLIGSLRALAEAAGAKVGDQLTVTLDKSDMSISAVATDLFQHEPGWGLVARLTGIEADEGMEGLVAALQCEKGEVRAFLSNRGDDVLKEALPKGPVNSELDLALAGLEAQLQQNTSEFQ
ncbi:MAG: hypothetical protein OXF50_24845 [Caldilineaceae bacterium]|nr:hypothetical protein [Caldilineaceae bacterium]